MKSNSALSLRQNVAQTWASNLLEAQDAPGCSYCGTTSLDDSIAAVLKALSIESASGLKACNQTNCVIVNAQSTIAINPNAGIIITPSAIDFGEVPVATPEPAIWILCSAGALALAIAKLLLGREPQLD